MVTAATPGTAAEVAPAALVSREVPMMGGLVGVHLLASTPAQESRAAEAADQVLDRMAAWATRLTRFSPTSELSRLNAAPADRVPVGPTLTAVLDVARGAEVASGGIVDVAMLDERLRAEGLLADDPPSRDAAALRRSPDGGWRAWSLRRGPRGAVVERPAGLRLDLDGIAKGWLADRALARLAGWPSALVDADGDIAARVAEGETWPVSIAHPADAAAQIGLIELRGAVGRDGRYGLATSGTSVHRWSGPDGITHHLIDPRTRRPARTDVVQATVLGRCAADAEVMAKTAVILGSDAAADALDRPDVLAFVLLTDRDELVLGPTTGEWLA